MPGSVIWLHQLSICYLVGFAPVFTKYHTNTKMLLSDTLIFQAKSIRQPLLGSTMAAHQKAETKQTLSGANGGHMWVWNLKVRSRVWDTEQQRFDECLGKCGCTSLTQKFNPRKDKKRVSQELHDGMEWRIRTFNSQDLTRCCADYCAVGASSMRVRCSWHCLRTLGSTSSNCFPDREWFFLSLSRPPLLMRRNEPDWRTG